MISHHVLPPLMVLALSGAVLPEQLARSRWAQEAPRTAVAGWLALTAAFVLGIAGFAVQLLLPYESSHALSNGVTGCLPWVAERCQLPAVGVLLDLSSQEYLAVGAGAAALALPAAALGHGLWRARRARGRHSATLRLVGRPDPALRAVVIDHATPAVYCLPGRDARVVVSSGAQGALTPSQLAAVLAHERAHIAGRHHVLVTAAETFGRLFRRLPLARLVRGEVPLLLEMAADDRALRRHARDALATALYAMASGQQAPPAAFAAGGPSAVLRMRRILTPHRNGHPVLRGLFASAAAVGAAAPLFLACCSRLG
ncbi:M56 family metallopeptidase [Streptomyces sp. NPDC058000]|uniref:M56 family metallopeptidase n=1 Tax=Streptomyces sp. NPDC058000 TaxID=3346299 RepID=UPI0036EE60E5